MESGRTRNVVKVKARAASLAAIAALAASSYSPGSHDGEEPAGLAAPAAGDRTVLLIQGDTLAGWVKRGGDAEYRVENGVIIGETRPNQPNTFLCTAREYSDFVLELDFYVDPALNSGIQIRSHARPEGKQERVFGYQVEIDPSERAWTAGFYDEARRGWLASPSEESRKVFKQQDWNSLRIEARGNVIRTWLNGIPATTIADGMDASGFIALQVHGVGPRADPLTVKWRNIRLTDLSAGR